MTNTNSIKIVEFDNLKHSKQVVVLWQDVFCYGAAHNSPELVIDQNAPVPVFLKWIPAFAGMTGKKL